MKRNLQYGAVCVLLMLCMGLIYAWSVFVKPLEDEFGWLRAQTSMTFTITMIFFCVGNILAGWLSAKKSVGFAIRCAAISLLIGFTGASFIHTLWGLYILYGVFCGTGVGFGYNILFNVVSKWYPKNNGLGAGILSLAFGAGGALLGALAVAIMEQVSWRLFFRVCGIFFCALTLVCSKWVVLPENRLEDVPHEDSPTPAPASGEERDFKTKEMLRTPSFWFYFVWNMCANGCGMVIIGHASPSVIELGAVLAVATLAASLAALSRAVGGILSGWVYDRYGYKTCMTMVSGFLMLGVLVMLASGFTKNYILLIVGITITGLGFGGSTANNIAIMNEFFGRKYFGMNFSILNQCVIFGSLLGSWLVGRIRDAAGVYLPAFLVPLGMAILSVICLICLRRPVKENGRVVYLKK
ncbi:MAG: MFS transporter [Oscillospiraceae bacterium]|nr:MFS transporter [Oscillospiraceae bacterium]